jgi:hypothetical protein
VRQLYANNVTVWALSLNGELVPLFCPEHLQYRTAPTR